MNDKDLKALENSENWDWENAETESGTKNRRAIVSVAFPREDFKKVAECARQIGVSVSAFIRHAAVDTAEKVSKGTQKSKLLPSEPGTYAIPSSVAPIVWVTTGAEKTKSYPEAGTTDAMPPRVLELISN
jgi:hypothetical protein